MKDDLFTVLRGRVRGEILRDEPMARHTSLKVGGAADFFITPADMDDLSELMAVLAETGTPHMVVGGGYNLLVRDGGIRGVVISLARLDRIQLVEGERVEVAAGVSNRRFVEFAREKGLGGVEFLCAIPGTVGGALAMNAGAHGRAVLELVDELVTLRHRKVVRTGRDRLDYGYRYLRLDPGEIILGAVFHLEPTDRELIDAEMARCMEHRLASQKIGFPNAGSFFRNPPGGSAWRLIDEAGLRGARVGGAQVSEIHANFLVNRGGARAADFELLAARIKDAVMERTGTALEEEVRIVGEN